MASRADLFVSADIEADGPIPGDYSMLSFGLAVGGTFDRRVFSRRDPAATTFYRELRPISARFDPDALAVSGLDRDRLLGEGADPAAAMSEAATWVRTVAAHRRPVLIAYPLSFDWTFLYWYFERFSATGCPFGFSSCLDIKTMYQQKANVVLDRVAKRAMPSYLLPTRRHTHHALDDAIEQAELLPDE